MLDGHPLPDRVEARSANDNTDDWPFWMVWGDGLNRTSAIAASLAEAWRPGAVLTTRTHAGALAARWNAMNEPHSGNENAS